MSITFKCSSFRLLSYSFNRHYSNSKNSNLLNILKSMPKERTHIAAAQKQRNKIKEKFAKYVPGKVTLQVLGTGATGAPRSLYIFSDQSRYLFNCGEGTQRLAHEHKMKLAKLEHIFITQPTWKNIGGLPGLALTIQDVGVPQITLHGPQGLEQLFVATRKFVVIKDLEIQMAECNEDTVFEDNVLKVKYISLFKNNDNVSHEETETNEVIEDDDTDYYAHEHSGKRITPESVSKDSQILLQHVKEKGVVMSYICQLQPRPGSLCLDSCVKFGVPAGPLLGKLKNGEDVTLKDGTLVRSKDVCEPNDPGPVFIVVDCPSEDYIDSLISNENFKKHQKFAKKEDDICSIVVHFTPKEVMDNPKYKNWMELFIPSTQHLAINENNNCMGSISVHRIQHKLNMLSNDLFPLLGDNGTQCVNNLESTLPVNKKIKSNHTNESDENSILMRDLTVKSRPVSPETEYIQANTFFNYHLRPKTGIDRSAELKLIPSQYIEETMSIENFPNTLRELKHALEQERQSVARRPYPKLVFLGTGSCIPNKTRNTSGILLTTRENHHIVIDCGEGTYGQIVRFFGQENSDKVLANIKAVYVSHLHADHHIGLVGLLLGRKRAIKKLCMERSPMFLFAPKQIMGWLNFYDKCFENINSEFELICNADLMKENKNSSDLETSLFNKFDMSDISTCYVKHCPNAFGVCFTLKDGCKITYSGDTMPTENLVELGKNSDILIHEATMEDELSQEAIIKMHSTTSQAIDIGKKMNAKYILLTHFSQRYAKLPRFNDNFTENVGIAFDNMQIRLDDLPVVPKLYPALKLMFAEHYEELEHKAVKRQLRIEREREASLDRKHGELKV